MTLKSLIGWILILAIIGGGGYILLFEREWAFSLWKGGLRRAKGYTPAKTPQEAIDKFKEAIKDRDFETAATYCGGEYAEQMRKGARAAQKLAEAIDNLVDKMQQKEIHAKKTKAFLKKLEPFPTSFSVGEYGKRSDDLVEVTLTEETTTTGPTGLDPIFGNERWNIDWLMLRTLSPKDSVVTVQIKEEGKGDTEEWKIYFPMTPLLRQSVDHLNEHYSDYVAALNQIKAGVLNEPLTQSDLDLRMKTELEKLAKQN
jgi:hypothetical protein